VNINIDKWDLEKSEDSEYHQAFKTTGWRFLSPVNLCIKTCWNEISLLSQHVFAQHDTPFQTVS